MTLETLLRAIEPQTVRGPMNVEVTGVTADSRRVRPGYVFVAVPGTTADGAVFADDAVRRGAACVVGSGRWGSNKACATVRVENARVALGQLCAAFHGFPTRELQVVGVTGTNGKTTIAYLTFDLLEAAGLRPGLVSTVEYRVLDRRIPADRTTPDAETLQGLFAQMRQKGCRSAVMEVSSHALDQARVEGVQYRTAIFTNLTRDHLDYHITMENYYLAKRRLFELTAAGAPGALAVVNTDDEWGRRLAGEVPAGLTVVTTSADGVGDVAASRVEVTDSGCRFHVESPWGAADIGSPLKGRFNVSNLLGAFAAGCAAGLSAAQAAETLRAARGAPGRLEPVCDGQPFQVYVDYAHTEDALRNVLGTLRELTPRRLIVVFGCGGNRDRKKREDMGRAAGELADAVVVTSDNPRREDPMAIISQVLEGMPAGKDCTVEPDRRRGIEAALRLAQPGDVVLIAGKGHEKIQEFADRKVPFDDVTVTRELLHEMGTSDPG